MRKAEIAAALAGPGRPSSDFDLNDGILPAPGRRLRDAAVLVPVWHVGGETRLILTMRSRALAHHPGQIAFPGGKIDAGDRDAQDAALRETEEEIALPRDRVEILGTLPAHETVTGFTVTPVVGWIEGAFDPVAEAGEVAEVFAVPFAHATDPARFRIEQRIWRGGPRRYYAVPWGPYYIWGATARMLRALADRVST